MLVDAYPLWLEAVERVLSGLDVATVGKATSPAQALRLVERHQPDILVTDVEFGPQRAGGAEYLKSVLAACPSVNLIVLATGEDSNLVTEAIDAGAMAYALKNVHPDDLAAAIRQVFHHSIFYAPTRGRPLARRPRPDAQAPGQAPSPAVAASDGTGRGAHQLTRRELEILTLVSEGLPNGDIGRRLWITEQTVKFHLSNIYRKLGVSNRTQASRWASLQGSPADDRATVS